MQRGDILWLFVCCPFLQVGAHEQDVILAPLDLPNVRLEPRLPQVPFQGLADSNFIVFEPLSISRTSQPAFQGILLAPNRVCGAEPV